MIFNLTKLQEQLNTATGSTDELSSILVEDPAAEYALEGVVNWFSLDFQAEHDCQLFFAELDNGERFSCIGYSSKAIYDAMRKNYLWVDGMAGSKQGTKLEWNYYFNTENVQKIYKDNLYQDGSQYKLIANVLNENLSLT